MVAMGMGRLAVGLFSDMNPGQALEFAGMLRSTVATYRKSLLDSTKAMGEPNEAILAECRAKIPDVDWDFSITTALHTIEATATWYEKTAKMDCGVRAWSYAYITSVVPLVPDHGCARLSKPVGPWAERPYRRRDMDLNYSESFRFGGQHLFAECS